MKPSSKAVTEHIAAALDALYENINDVDFLGQALTKLERYRLAYATHLEQLDHKYQILRKHAIEQETRLALLETAKETTTPPEDQERSKPCDDPKSPPQSP